MASRTVALLGESTVRCLSTAHVAIFGVGGVGGWCAEALARTGVGHLTLVDFDCVAASNLNRQCPATIETLGTVKVEAMRHRLAMVAPRCEVTTCARRFETMATFGGFEGFDFIVDAIDSVGAKAELILGALSAGLPVISSLGAAFRLDPTKVEVRRFACVTGDGLARALRQRFKRLGHWPLPPFSCVCSSEAPRSCAAGAKGSVMQVTAAFGLALAAEVVRWADGHHT